MNTSEEIASISAALASVIAEIENPKKEREADAGKYKYKYADISDVLDVARPILAKHGIAPVQFTTINENQVTLVTRLQHKSGEWMQSEYPVCAIGNDHQRMGAAMTYARRTHLSAMIGIAAQEDTDGSDAAATGDTPDRKRMSAHQAKTEVNWDEIQKLIDNAPSLKKLDAIMIRVTANQNIWPRSYVSQAHERIQRRHNELLAQDIDPGQLLEDLEVRFSQAESEEDVEDVWTEFEHYQEKVDAETADRMLELHNHALDRMFVNNNPLMAG